MNALNKKRYVFSSGLMQIAVDAETEGRARNLFKKAMNASAKQGLDMRHWSWQVTLLAKAVN